MCETDSPEGGCTVPAGHVFVIGDNRPTRRTPRSRPDQGIEHRGPRVRAHLAARTASASCSVDVPVGRGSVVATRRRSRPCGRRGRSRRRRCPGQQRRGCGASPGCPRRTPCSPKRWNSATRPAVHSEWCRFEHSMPAPARSAAWRSSGSPTLRRRGVDELHVGRLLAQPHEQLESSTSRATAARSAPAARATSMQHACRPRGPSRRSRARSRCRTRRRGRRGGARRARRARRRCSGHPLAPASPRRTTASWASTTSPSADRRASVSSPRARAPGRGEMPGVCSRARRRGRPGGRT